MNKNILIPIDFSDASDDAINYGMKWVEQTNDHLVLFHANNIPDSDPFTPAFAYHKTSEVELDYQQLVMEKMKELRAKINEITGNETRVSISTAIGEPVSEVLDVIKAEKIDIIMLGMAGEEAEEALFYKDQILDIIEEVSVPVVVIPEGYKFSPIHRIAYGIDEGDENYQTLKNLCRLAKHFDAEITVLHILTETEKDEITEDRLKEIRAEVNYEKLDFTSLESEDVIEGYNAYFKLNQTDLLAMQTHHRNFLQKIFDKSITREMATKTKVPLLVYHD